MKKPTCIAVSQGFWDELDDQEQDNRIRQAYEAQVFAEDNKLIERYERLLDRTKAVSPPLFDAFMMLDICTSGRVREPSVAERALIAEANAEIEALLKENPRLRRFGQWRKRLIEAERNIPKKCWWCGSWWAEEKDGNLTRLGWPDEE